jgi:hypothetical protein
MSLAWCWNTSCPPRIATTRSKDARLSCTREQTVSCRAWAPPPFIKTAAAELLWKIFTWFMFMIVFRYGTFRCDSPSVAFILSPRNIMLESIISWAAMASFAIYSMSFLSTSALSILISMTASHSLYSWACLSHSSDSRASASSRPSKSHSEGPTTEWRSFHNPPTFRWSHRTASHLTTTRDAGFCVVDHYDNNDNTWSSTAWCVCFANAATKHTLRRRSVFKDEGSATQRVQRWGFGKWLLKGPMTKDMIVLSW